MVAHPLTWRKLHVVIMCVYLLSKVWCGDIAQISSANYKKGFTYTYSLSECHHNFSKPLTLDMTCPPANTYIVTISGIGIGSISARQSREPCKPTTCGQNLKGFDSLLGPACRNRTLCSVTVTPEQQMEMLSSTDDFYCDYKLTHLYDLLIYYQCVERKSIPYNPIIDLANLPAVDESDVSQWDQTITCSFNLYKELPMRNIFDIHWPQVLNVPNGTSYCVYEMLAVTDLIISFGKAVIHRFDPCNNRAYHKVHGVTLKNNTLKINRKMQVTYLQGSNFMEWLNEISKESGYQPGEDIDYVTNLKCDGSITTTVNNAPYTVAPENRLIPPIYEYEVEEKPTFFVGGESNIWGSVTDQEEITAIPNGGVDPPSLVDIGSDLNKSPKPTSAPSLPPLIFGGQWDQSTEAPVEGNVDPSSDVDTDTDQEMDQKKKAEKSKWVGSGTGLAVVFVIILVLLFMGFRQSSNSKDEAELVRRAETDDISPTPSALSAVSAVTVPRSITGSESLDPHAPPRTKSLREALSTDFQQWLSKHNPKGKMPFGADKNNPPSKFPGTLQQTLHV